MAVNTIGNKAIDKTIITGNTTVTAAAGDTVLISDISDSGNLKKASISTLGNTVDSTFITANTTVTAASDDSILISDTSDSGNLKKALISTITDTMVANGGDNRILTDTATAGSINGESNLTFDGTTLALTGNQTASGTITASGVVTGAGFTIGSAAINEAELEILDGATVSTAELNSLASIGSDTVATQLATKAPLASPALTGTATAVNLTVSGNLTINGSTTTVSSTNTTITDNIIELNSGASSNANDSGILIERGSTGDNAFMGFDESSDTFILGTTTATADATGNLTVTPSKITVGGVVIGSADINETELEILDGATLTTTELNYVDGVTSSIQTQLDARLPLAGGTMTGDLILGDNIRLEIGSNSNGDLAVYHDGSNSYIDERGTGDLIIKGSDTIFIQNASGVKGAEFWSAGTAQLNHNGSKKFETTSAGATLTGDLTATGSFIIGSASMNETDLEKLDGITNGTAAANKALVLGASKEISTITTATITNLSTTTLTGGAITSSNFAGVTTLLIKNSAGTTLKTIRSPSS